MAISSKLKVHKASGSLRLSLPPEWVKEENVYPQDELNYVGTNGMILFYKLRITTNEEEIDRCLKEMKVIIMMEQERKRLARSDKKINL